jgi:hypothetical protein
MLGWLLDCGQSHLGVQSASAEGGTCVTNPPEHITMATLLLGSPQVRCGRVQAPYSRLGRLALEITSRID